MEVLKIIKNPFSDDPDASESDSAGEPEVHLKYDARRTNTIVTQEITFSGGHETTISFCMERSQYPDPWCCGHDSVPEVPRDFDGDPVVDRIKIGEVATVNVVETTEVAVWQSKHGWHDESEVSDLSERGDVRDVTITRLRNN